MAVGVFIESDNESYKKSSIEALCYGKRLADQLGTSCVAISAGNKYNNDLGVYGASNHVHIANDNLSSFNPQAYARAVQEVVDSNAVDHLIISQTYTGKSLAPIIAVKMNAGLVTGVVGDADTAGGFKVKKTCFSNKAFAYVEMKSDKKVLTLIPNSFDITETGGSTAAADVATGVGSDAVNTTITETNKVTGKIVLTEAELVVSGGRGLKGPENWGMVEELADIIGAATACSKPVSDMEWRPHSEHVGQTGITIKPNLYIAIGISGAIQHLAGVGSSKVICVINTDPEAPFFKAADYGIVGDAFDVVPKLIKRAKEIKAS